MTLGLSRVREEPLEVRAHPPVKHRGLGRPWPIARWQGDRRSAHRALPDLAIVMRLHSAWGYAPTILAALGGVLGVIDYLRPMPDLLAQSTETPKTPETAATMVWLVAVIAIGVAPSLLWGFIR